MAVNFVKEAATITLLAPSGGVVSGTGYVIGSIFGVALATVAAGLPCEFGIEGEWILPKPNSVTTFAQGAGVWFDTATGLCKATGAGFFQIGIATVAAAATDATVRVRLDATSVVAS